MIDDESAQCPVDFRGGELASSYCLRSDVLTPCAAALRAFAATDAKMKIDRFVAEWLKGETADESVTNDSLAAAPPVSVIGSARTASQNRFEPRDDLAGVCDVEVVESANVWEDGA